MAALRVLLQLLPERVLLLEGERGRPPVVEGVEADVDQVDDLPQVIERPQDARRTRPSGGVRAANVIQELQVAPPAMPQQVLANGRVLVRVLGSQLERVVVAGCKCGIDRIDRRHRGSVHSRRVSRATVGDGVGWPPRALPARPSCSLEGEKHGEPAGRHGTKGEVHFGLTTQGGGGRRR